jgi:hypothetical protein
MSRTSSRIPMAMTVAAMGLAALIARPAPVAGFTQSGAAVSGGALFPMGHEWLIRMAALELLSRAGGAQEPGDPEDPRRHWTRGLAKNLDLTTAKAELARVQRDGKEDERYRSTYGAVYAAIIGERWVDLGGFNFAKAKGSKIDCLDHVTQQPAELQSDHFLRRHDDVGGAGGVAALARSRVRFMARFLEAALAPRGLLSVWDGGAERAQLTVDRNYFLLGVAMHTLQDSFSSEHTVRLPEDNYERLRQVKSYLCSAGSEQHTHDNLEVIAYTSGDVIWKEGSRLDAGWESFKASNLKPASLVAVEATKDVWAAFFRVMAKAEPARGAAAIVEAQQLADRWLRFDEREVKGWYEQPERRDATFVLDPSQKGSTGQSVTTCMRNLDVDHGDQLRRVREIEANRRSCLYNVAPAEGFAGAADPALDLPYQWQWKRDGWKQPPASWLPGTGSSPQIKVTLRNVQTGAPVVDGAAGQPDSEDHWLVSRPQGEPLQWIVVGDSRQAFLRLADRPRFFAYRADQRALRLYDTAEDAAFRLEPLPGGKVALYNLRYGEYVALDAETRRLIAVGARGGVAKNAQAQWQLEPVPASR